VPTVRSNGISIYYEVQGRGDPVLIIGGLATDLSQIGSLVNALSEKHQVISFDNRGAGRTDKPDAPYTVEMMAEDAAGLLSEIGISPVNLLGISLGGRIAITLTLTRPELVKSLILASTTARMNYKRGVMWSLSNLLVRIPQVRRIGTEYPQPYFAYVRQREASRGYDATGRLHEISKPTLIIHGSRDNVAPFSLAQEIHGRVKGSQLVAFDGGHTFMFSKQWEFASEVERFLSEDEEGHAKPISRSADPPSGLSGQGIAREA